MNLLTDAIFTSRDGKLSLAELLAAMASGDVRCLAGLRPHQRPAWHMFLVQLAALALWRSELAAPPVETGQWAAALRRLTPSHADDAPWRLVVADRRKPAFMQPPVPDQPLKWSSVRTPDALDMLITSRNHDLKQEVAQEASAEDWTFALVSLQTAEGYGGRGNQGIVRMNGGHSSRPMVGLAPARTGDTSIDSSAWWQRDVRQLLAARRRGLDSLGTPQGTALLWCLDWPEGQELDLESLDPWFIEACRRVRLVQSGRSIVGQRSTSRSPRIAGKVYHGNVGDPWAPVHQSGKSLTLGTGGEFDYRRLTDLMFSGEWTVPLLARAGEDEHGDMLLVAEAFSRGNNKTEGFKSRVVPTPARAVSMFRSRTTAGLAQAQVKEVRAIDAALRYALALAAARGVWNDIQRSHYAFCAPASKSFNRSADQMFFPSLWRRLDAVALDEASGTKAKVDFLKRLKSAAESALDAALPTVPCPVVYRTRTAVRARRAFMAKLRRDEATRAMFAEEENTDGA